MSKVAAIINASWPGQCQDQRELVFIAVPDAFEVRWTGHVPKG
jgi:hypothetical protein